MIEYIFSPQSVEALGWTLLHSLWQGAVFAIVLVLILIALRSFSAQSRYVVSVGLLSAFFLTLSATFWLQWQEAGRGIEVIAATLTEQSSGNDFIFNNNEGEIVSPESKGVLTTPMNSQLEASGPASWGGMFRNYYDKHLPLLVTIWFVGVLFLQLRLLGQLAYVQRLKHYGTELFPASWSAKIEELEGKLRIQKKVGYLTSLRIESPMVIGWLKPVVLMPRQLFNSLSETEIYAVLAHELAHIRREDFIVNLMQTFLCNIFFFHPGVWWMSNRIDDEREHCCDDLAVAATGPATSYAKTLINVSEYQLKQQGNTPLAMAFSGKKKRRERLGFSGRIRRLFKVGSGTGSFREGFATAFILITALLLGVAATGSTLQSTDSSRLTDVESELKPIEDIQEESGTQSIQQGGAEVQNTTVVTSITTSEDILPVSNISEGFEHDNLPVEAPTMPVRSDDTRIAALVSACAEGDIDFVKTLINSGVDVNGVGPQGFTPLMMAASENSVSIVEYLLKKGADVNQKFNGWTALIEAADEGSLASMKLLLKAGAEVNYSWTPHSPSAASMAASEGNLDCLQLLYANGADLNGIGKSVPPLHIASEEGEKDIVDYLISKKVNINKKDASGRTALMYAASEGQKSVVITLVESGADVSVVDMIGDNAKDYAEDENQYSIQKYLEVKEGYHYDSDGETDKEKRPEIHRLTVKGLIEKVERLVAQGADVNVKDEDGRTALHLASALNHNIDMRVLINLGADINAQDKQGRTPLMYAAADGKRGAAVLLISYTANVNLRDVDGMTALDWSHSGSNPDLTNFLGLITEKNSRSNKYGKREQKSNSSFQQRDAQSGSNRDANSEAQTDEEREIQSVSQQETQKVIQKIVQKKVEQSTFKEIEKQELFHVGEESSHLRQFNLEGKTPAILNATRNGNLRDCRNLLDSGHSANASDDTGQTALMIAASTNRLEIAKLLIEKGADVNKSSASGLTALHYAALEDHDAIARLLLKNIADVNVTMHYSSTDGNKGNKPLVWEYIGATPLLVAVEASSIKVIPLLLGAGASPNHKLVRNEYLLNRNRESYLSGGEVMGLDTDFLKDVKLQTKDDNWTPYKQALHLNKREILSLFPN